MSIFGNVVAKRDPNLDYRGRPYRDDYDAGLAAEKAWKARRQEAIDAFPNPEPRYRVVRDGEAWRAERRDVYVSEYPTIGGKLIECPAWRRDRDDYFLVFGIITYAPEDYAAADPFAPSLSWTHIGPQRQYPGYDGKPEWKTASFSTFAEAQRWLTDFLTPEVNTAYFNTQAERIEPEENA